MSRLSPLLALTVPLCGCMDLMLQPGPTDPQSENAPKVHKGGWDTRWLAAAGGGLLIPFDPDMRLSTGYAAQAGYGEGWAEDCASRISHTYRRAAATSIVHAP